MKNVCIVGGGPAGMMAAYAAAANGHNVTLFEKNEKLGKKLYITGKGRCNVTNNADISDFFDCIVTNRNFMYSALYTFSNIQLMDMLEEYGITTKVERGGRVFPVSDKSSDVIKALGTALKAQGVHVIYNTKVQKVYIKDNRAEGIEVNGMKQPFHSIIIATGGMSYTSTGSTGDGFRFAKEAGHHVTDLKPSLIGVETVENVSSLAGLSLKNISLSLVQDGKIVYKQQGEMLFTHTGLSGPLVLSASAYMDDTVRSKIIIDLKPALDDKTLDARLLRDFTDKSNRDFANVLLGLVPAKLTSIISRVSGIDGDKKAHSITKQERKVLGQTLKSLPFNIKRKRPIEEAIITRGGIDVKEIDASTMQSKCCQDLYFAGEVIDVDALTGGYNLQIAFSTGFLAGISI